MGSLLRLKLSSLPLKMCSKVALLLLVASTASASSLYGGYGYPWSYGWASAGTVPVAAGTYTPPDYAAAAYDPVATAWNSVGTVPVRGGYSSAYAPVVSSYPMVSYPYAPAHTTSAYGQVIYSHPTGYMASRASAHGDLGDRDAYSGSYATPVTSYPVYAYHPGYVSYGNEYGLLAGYNHALAYDEKSLTRIPYMERLGTRRN